MIIFSEYDWFVMRNNYDTQWDFVEIQFSIMTNPLGSDSFDADPGTFGMGLNDTFWELKEGIQEALGVQAESLLLMWNDNELLDNQTPDEGGMDCCYFGVENVELYTISNEFEP